MGKVVHFEIPTDDSRRAKEFYGSIFGWQLQDMQGEAMGLYTLAMTTPVDQETQAPTEPGAINGGLMKRAADTPAPGDHDRGRWDRRRTEEGRGRGRQYGAAEDGDPRDGRVRLLQGLRRQRDGSLGDHP